MKLISFKKVWQDTDIIYGRTDLYEIEANCVSENVSVKGNFYVCDKTINKLIKNLKDFYNLKIVDFKWETSSKKVDYDKNLMLEFKADLNGDITCKVYMELDKELYKYNFVIQYLNFEEIKNFTEELKKLNVSEVGFVASTNKESKNN